MQCETVEQYPRVILQWSAASGVLRVLSYRCQLTIFNLNRFFTTALKLTLFYFLYKKFHTISHSELFCEWESHLNAKVTDFVSQCVN